MLDNEKKNNEIAEELPKETTLNENQLDDVSGGGWWGSSWTYESGKKPRYKVGQVILGDFYIVKIHEGKKGLFHEEFTYYVVSAFDHSKVIDECMYESELVKMEDAEAARR